MNMKCYDTDRTTHDMRRVTECQTVTVLAMNQDPKAPGQTSSGSYCNKRQTNNCAEGFCQSFHGIMEINAPHVRSQITQFVNPRLCQITHCAECTEAKPPNEIALREKKVTVVSQYDQILRGENV